MIYFTSPQTRKHLMEKANPPMCDTCANTPITVYHILL